MGWRVQAPNSDAQSLAQAQHQCRASQKLPVLIFVASSMQCMHEIRVGPPKAASNVKKHKVTFEVAKSVFYDDFAVQFFDEEHATDEDRFLLLGMSSDARLLLVCHCEREGGYVVRIISTRKATQNEAQYYRGE